MNLYQKLVEVRKTVPYLQKAAKGYQYQYTASSQVLEAIRDKLDDLGILLKPEIVEHRVTTSVNDKGKTTYFTELVTKMTWINAEKPDEREESMWYAQGLDIEGEKGTGKALTYGEKYFILKYFNVPTDVDDPDRRNQSKKQQTPKVASKPDEPATFRQTDTIWRMVAKTVKGNADEVAKEIAEKHKGRLTVSKQKGIWVINTTKEEASKIIKELQEESQV